MHVRSVSLIGATLVVTVGEQLAGVDVVVLIRVVIVSDDRDEMVDIVAGRPVWEILSIYLDDDSPAAVGHIGNNVVVQRDANVVDAVVPCHRIEVVGPCTRILARILPVQHVSDGLQS